MSLNVAHPAVTLPPVICARSSFTGPTTSALRSLWLRMTSSKLVAHLAVSGIPDPSYDGIGFADSANWQLTPHVPPEISRSNRPSALLPIFRDEAAATPRPLPSGYEIQSAVRLWLARLTLRVGYYTFTDDNGNLTSQASEGKIVASCTIEPAPDACFGPGEYDALIQGCQMFLTGSPPHLLAPL